MTVLTFPGTRTLPDLAPETRKLLLDWLAAEATNGMTVIPEEVITTLLDAYASPSLAGEARAQAWDDCLTWVDLRIGAIARTIHPEDVLGRPGTADEAEEVARERASGELSRLVFGNQTTARGSGYTGETA